MVFRSKLFAALLGASMVLPAFAQDGETLTRALKARTWYVSPTASYVLADDDRGTDDGWGGTIAIGKKVTNALTLELMASYTIMDPATSHWHLELTGTGTHDGYTALLYAKRPASGMWDIEGFVFPGVLPEYPDPVEVPAQ